MTTDHESSYKGKQLVGVAHLQFRDLVSPLSSQWRAWGHAGRHHAPCFLIRKQQEMVWVLHWGKLEQKRPQSPQWHTSSNKSTPPNSATPYGPSIQTHESMGPFLFKSPQAPKLTVLLLSKLSAEVNCKTVMQSKDGYEDSTSSRRQCNASLWMACMCE